MIEVYPKSYKGSREFESECRMLGVEEGLGLVCPG